MKQYIKDGIIKTRNQIVIKGQRTIKDKDGNDKVITTNTYNPTEKMVLAAGWMVHVAPVYEPTIEDYRRDKIEEITRYDSSREVNEFYIQEMPVWLDKATRSGLMLRFNSELALKKENTTLWYEGHSFTLPLTTAIQMLYALENYASECYDNTQYHLTNIDHMDTIEAIEDYDITTGYPNKLTFSL